MTAVDAGAVTGCDLSSVPAPHPVEPIRSCSPGGPSLGMDVDVAHTGLAEPPRPRAE
jgi:hypothetical protein